MIHLFGAILGEEGMNEGTGKRRHSPPFFLNLPFRKVARRVKLQSSHHKEKNFVAMCGDGCNLLW